MPKRRGQFKGEKRRKELVRLQKQEEKRKRRFGALQTEEEAGTPATDAEKQEEGESPAPEPPV